MNKMLEGAAMQQVKLKQLRKARDCRSARNDPENRESYRLDPVAVRESNVSMDLPFRLPAVSVRPVA